MLYGFSQSFKLATFAGQLVLLKGCVNAADKASHIQHVISDFGPWFHFNVEMHQNSAMETWVDLK